MDYIKNQLAEDLECVVMFILTGLLIWGMFALLGSLTSHPQDTRSDTVKVINAMQEQL